jgi:putative exosortase-associated protein (TIGR04073 family)
MKHVLLFSAILLSLVVSIPSVVVAEQQPEMIADKMAVKFTRGVANTFTCIVELPKQTVLTVREMGTPGYLIGPIKGVGMTLYRGLTGITEAVFFMVPQPGYYDPLIDPAYVWRGWAPKRDTSEVISEVK